MFVINLTSETSSMNVWDAMDYVTRRCEVASGGIGLDSRSIPSFGDVDESTGLIEYLDLDQYVATDGVQHEQGAEEPEEIEEI
uniref:Uncharacterized protein n=1 Tax=Acrobeloides nanus TaxID=290746 RepID=A0A914EEB3_9BILA